MDMQEELNMSKEEIKKAKQTLKSYRTMLVEMETAGQLMLKEDYALLEYKNGTLYINDQKQSRRNCWTNTGTILKKTI